MADGGPRPPTSPDPWPSPDPQLSQDPQRPPDRAPAEPGLRVVLLVGAVVVAAVLGAAALTFVLPEGARDVVLRTPLLILILIGGTAGVLWRISRPGRPGH